MKNVIIDFIFCFFINRIDWHHLRSVCNFITCNYWIINETFHTSIVFLKYSAISQAHRHFLLFHFWFTLLFCHQIYIHSCMKYVWLIFIIQLFLLIILNTFKFTSFVLFVKHNSIRWVIISITNSMASN